MEARGQATCYRYVYTLLSKNAGDFPASDIVHYGSAETPLTPGYSTVLWKNLYSLLDQGLNGGRTFECGAKSVANEDGDARSFAWSLFISKRRQLEVFLFPLVPSDNSPFLRHNFISKLYKNFLTFRLAQVKK